jgi:hypothetical protein
MLAYLSSIIMKHALKSSRKLKKKFEKCVLTDRKLLLQFARAAIIEALRRNPETCNFVLYNISNIILLLLLTDLDIFR